MENKPRLIDADKLIQEHGCDVTNWDEPYAVSIKSIECAPTVDAVEVVHGRWIEINPRKDPEGWIEYDYQCSNCTEISWEESNYCPNCGARMDLEKK